MHTFPANNPSEDRSIYFEDKNTKTRIFGVFDGHGGWNVSNYLHHNMTRVLLKNMDNAKAGNEQYNCSADSLEASLLTTFTELEEAYIEKIRAAYELGFGGTFSFDV